MRQREIEIGRKRETWGIGRERDTETERQTDIKRTKARNRQQYNERQICESGNGGRDRGIEQKRHGGER